MIPFQVVHNCQVAKYRTFTMEPPEVVALTLAPQRHETALEHMKKVLQTWQVDRTARSEFIMFMALFVDANGLHNGNTYMNPFGANFVLNARGGELKW
jgi:hypothetical protein